jgi:hypothetical protein
VDLAKLAGKPGVIGLTAGQAVQENEPKGKPRKRSHSFTGGHVNTTGKGSNYVSMWICPHVWLRTYKRVDTKRKPSLAEAGGRAPCGAAGRILFREITALERDSTRPQNRFNLP